MNKPFSIPTEYAGRTFRSRLEAVFAHALTTFKIRWEYEPKSFVLQSGLTYWPDFYLPDLRTWVECRGYTNERGEAQLDQFANELPAGDAFLVVRPGKPLRFVYPPTADVGRQIADQWLAARAAAHLAGNGAAYDSLCATIADLKAQVAEDDTGKSLEALSEAIRQRNALVPQRAA